MLPPLVCFTCFNRLCLTSQNLKALLNTNEDFQLCILDNNSTDKTWDYIQTLSDPRIIEKKKFDVNRYIVYAVNYALSLRKPGQYFLTLDNDVHIHNNCFISKFLNVMDCFPDVGMLGAVRDNWLQSAVDSSVVKKYKLISSDNARYIQIDPVVGCFLCFRPELLDVIGYLNEETCGADSDLCNRINNYTKWHTGIMLPDDIKITQEQSIACKNCSLQLFCNNITPTCVQIYSKRRKVSDFVPIWRRKNSIYMQELASNKREVYCASIHDPESLKNHYYNYEWAEENFNFFINSSN